MTISMKLRAAASNRDVDLVPAHGEISRFVLSANRHSLEIAGGKTLAKPPYGRTSAPRWPG